MPRYTLTVSYDGTDFCGWQKQFPHADRAQPEHLLDAPDAAPQPAAPTTERTPGRVELRTVQSVLERAVREVVREPVTVKGASRTDAGVHARGQVAAFTCADEGGRTGGWPAARGTEPLVRAINSRLPDDVLVTEAEVAAPDFNPIGGATSKRYTYTLFVSPHRPLWNRRTVFHLWTPLDVAAMDAAAGLLVGEHDFAGFAAAGHGRLSTVRTVFDCRVQAQQSEGAASIITIDITGSGFLWNMVRIIAGTLVEVGRGRLMQDDLRAALQTGDRRRAGPTLPPQGLCLEWIRYGERPAAGGGQVEDADA